MVSKLKILSKNIILVKTICQKDSNISLAVPIPICHLVRVSSLCSLNLRSAGALFFWFPVREEMYLKIEVTSLGIFIDFFFIKKRILNCHCKSICQHFHFLSNIFTALINNSGSILLCLSNLLNILNMDE